MTHLQYKDHKIRMLMENHEMWLQADHVCRILLIDDVEEMMEQVDPRDKMRRMMGDAGELQDVWFINKDGAAAMAEISGEREAKRLNWWVNRIASHKKELEKHK